MSEEVPVEDEEEEAPADEEAGEEDEDGVVEDEADEDKPKTKKVDKTVWDWVLINDNKPIWTRK